MSSKKRIILIIYFTKTYCIIRDVEVQSIVFTKTLQKEKGLSLNQRKPAVSSSFLVQRYITKVELLNMFSVIERTLNSFRKKYPKQSVKFIVNQSVLDQKTIFQVIERLCSLTRINYISLPIEILLVKKNFVNLLSIFDETIEVNYFGNSFSIGDCRRFLSLVKSENKNDISLKLGNFRMRKYRLSGQVFIGRTLTKLNSTLMISSLDLAGSSRCINIILSSLNETTIHLYLKELSFESRNVKCGKAGSKSLGSFLAKCEKIELIRIPYESIDKSSQSMLDRAFIKNNKIPEKYYFNRRHEVYRRQRRHQPKTDFQLFQIIRSMKINVN
eukprot:snap_masked-scaffold_14-processed-gene-6.30-mRNA-1 protein AED:1.00 eAED:1.00 QI:0/-1/0/0/-1/1/1/0/328